MNKIFKILLAIFISLAVFVCFDVLFFYYVANDNKKVIKSVEKYRAVKKLPSYFIKLKPIKEFYRDNLITLRPVMNPDSKLNSIVIFGCSYAYGYVFPNEQTISYVMSKYSERPIYNRAINSTGVQHAIYQLKDENIYKTVKTKPKYVFYVLMDYSGHFERLYFTNMPSVIDKNYYLTYKQKGNELVERKPFLNLYYNFAIIRHIQNKLIQNWVYYNFWKKPNKKIFDLFILHFKTLNQLIKSKWGDEENGEYPKLVILTFEHTQKNMWEDEIKKEGIDVIDIADTIGVHELYKTSKGYFEPEISAHPNGKVWEKLIPELKKIYPDL